MNPETDLFGAKDVNLQLFRRSLLPWWMKLFVWLFIVLSLFVPLVLLMYALGSPIALSLYGLEAQNPFTLTGTLLMLIFLFKGLVGYGLWTGKNWAVKLGIVDGIIGIGICLFVMFGMQSNSSNEDNIRLELLVLIPYLIKLFKLKSLWDGNI